MNASIRMVDFAIAVCWVILIAFSASAVYSVKDLGLDFGEAKIGFTPDGKILYSLQVEIANRGYYNIGLFNITTEVLDENGSIMTEGSTVVPVIPKGEKLSIFHNLTFDPHRLLGLNQERLVNDTWLDAIEVVSMKLAEIIPVQASLNSSIPWGAPLHGFKLGEPRYAVLNYTCTQVSVPISFDNHAFFDVVGETEIRMYSSTNQLMGVGRTKIEAAQHSHYDGLVELGVGVSTMTQTGRFELEFQTSLFSFGPLVIAYG
jgi:hypothetical protein